MKLAFVVKVSKLCNLRCSYCYEMPELQNPARMAPANIEKMFTNIREFTLRLGKDSAGHLLEFVWHGGEPFAQPISYWETILDLQRRVFGVAPPTFTLRNVVQSNLTLITEKHLPLLKHFHIGFSFDVINDLRVDVGGRSTSAVVRKKVEYLLSAGVPLSGIAVISRANITYGEIVARYFLQRHLSFRALNVYQATDALPGARDAAVPFVRYLKFFQDLGSLPEVQEALERQDVIEPLSTARKLLATLEKGGWPQPSEEECWQKEWILAVNTNGDVFSPGDCYNANFRYGNIFSQPLDELLFSSAGRKLRIQRSRKRLGAICSHCFLYRKACDGTYASHATPEEAREFRRHKACYFGSLANWMRKTSGARARVPQRATKKIKRAKLVSETLYLNLTYQCNSRCLFCAADVKYKQKTQPISVAQLSAMLNEKQYLRIDLSGGEPTIHPEILEIVKLCRTHTENVTILTHGRRLQDAAFAEALLAAGAGTLVIPLYGTEAARHDFVSHVRGSFDQTVEGLNNLQRFRGSYNFAVELKLLLTRYTAPLNREIYRYAVEHFPRAFTHVSVCPLIYSQSTLDFKEDFCAAFEELKTDFFEVVDKIRSDGVYPLRINEFPPCFFPSEIRLLAHPRLNRPPSATVHSYADERSSGLVSIEGSAREFRGSVFGNQLVQCCRKCRYDSYCAGRPSPYFSASYLRQFGEKEFHPAISPETSRTRSSRSMTRRVEMPVRSLSSPEKRETSRKPIE